MKRLIFLGLLFPLFAYAGGSTVGNGGNSVVCQDAQGHSKAEVFDLYEGRVIRGLVYQESPAPYLDQARNIIGTLGAALGQGPKSDGGVIDLLERNIQHLIFLPSGTGLKPIPDGDEFILPKTCQMVQTANFLDFEHIYIDSDIWQLLSNTQKAALLIHETIYEYLRDPGSKGNFVEKTSVRTRLAVSALISGVQPKPYLEPENPVEGAKQIYCTTDDALENDRPSSYFYAYPRKDGRIAIQMITAADRHFLTRTLILSEPSASGLDWENILTQRGFNIEGNVSSAFTDNIWAEINFSPDNPKFNKIWVRDGDGNDYSETFVCKVHGG